MKSSASVYMCLLLVACTSNVNEIGPSGRQVSLRFSYDKDKVASMGARAIPDISQQSYNWGYSDGCAAGKDNSVLTQPHTVYPGLEGDQYIAGFNKGFVDCSPKLVSSQFVNGSLDLTYESGGGGGGCVSYECSIITTTNDISLFDPVTGANSGSYYSCGTVAGHCTLPIK